MLARSRSPSPCSKPGDVDRHERSQNLPGVLTMALVRKNFVAVQTLKLDLVRAHMAPIEHILAMVGIGKDLPVEDPVLVLNWFEFFEDKLGAKALGNAGIVWTEHGMVLSSPKESIMDLAAYLNRFDFGVDGAKMFHANVRMYQDEKFQNRFNHDLGMSRRTRW